MKSIHAFTDGSFKLVADGPPALGWSTVIIAEKCNGDLAFVGWFAAEAGHDSELVSANGIQYNNVAEVLAIVWTLVWSLSAPVKFDLHVHTDSTFALQVAADGPSLGSDGILTRILAGLAQATRAH